MPTFEPIPLEGRFIRLEPLAAHHKQGLCAAIQDGKLWTLFVTHVPHPNDIEAFYAQAQASFKAGEGLTFVIIDKKTGKISGSTQFMNTDWQHKRLTIGLTFIGKSWQKTRTNTEAKLLMLKYAFQSLNMNRVEFYADYLNFKSRQAILRLGAKEEGLLRCHRVMADGRIRDSMLYSIVFIEWDGVKLNLLHKLKSWEEG
ncbi:MAG: GNAT family N-acetyltransferase [Ghiorsea sp.]|nr:GNAT family N-acetyltransferase [Ghiorsea sp.]